jgi:FtsZ-binding cell division protein ZapB
MATKKKVVDLKPTSITDEQLKNVQTTVNGINRAQMEIGKLESQKHQILHQIISIQEDLGKLQAELEKEYGTVDINIQTGEINYDVEADKKN